MRANTMNAVMSQVANSRETQRLVRWIAVGVLSTTVDFGVLVALRSPGLPLVLANSLSYSAGIVVNFVLNRWWTYSESHSKRMSLQFLQFTIVSLCGLMLNNTLVLVLSSLLGQLFNEPNNAYVPAKLIATGAVLIWNFVVNRLWTFSDTQDVVAVASISHVNHD